MINFETIKQVVWLSDEFIQKPIRGVMFTFHGPNSVGEHGAPSDEEIALAKEGFLVVSPYYGPWSWMNRLARKFIDELIASVYAAFQLFAK